MATDPRIHALRLGEFRIPTRLRAARLNDKSSAQTAEFLDNLRDHLVTSKRPIEEYPDNLSSIGRGLMWVGPPGSGKTTEAVQTLLGAYYRYNMPVLFLGYADYIAMRKEQWSIQNKAAAETRWWEIENIIHAARTVPLLCLDDVGKEHDGVTGFAAGELDLLLRQRHRDARPTFVTTNIPAAKWGEAYNESMGSFVKEAFTQVKLIGKDRRVQE